MSKLETGSEMCHGAGARHMTGCDSCHISDNVRALIAVNIVDHHITYVGMGERARPLAAVAVAPHAQFDMVNCT